MELSHDHKRSQRRVEAAIAIRVHGIDSAGNTYDDEATALEVSRRGLSFLTKLDLAAFATLTVTIVGRGPVRANEGPTDFFTEATVVRSIKEDDAFYRVGVRFMGATLPMYSAEGV
jgi:hypothetical protein